MIDLGYLAAFLGGVLTLLSPCGAMLLPSFFAYAFDDARVLVARTGAFFLGVAVVMVPMGAGAGALGGLVLDHQDTLLRGAGVALMAFGLLILSGRGRWLTTLGSWGQRRTAGATSPVAVAVLGAVYAVAGTCTGPILGSVLTVAALQGDPVGGAALMAVFAVGMAAPLFVLALIWERWNPRARLRGLHRELQIGPWRIGATTLVTGLALLAVGAWFLLGDAAAGVAGLGPSAASELQLQQAALRLGAAIPDGLLLGAVALIAGITIWRRVRRPTATAAGATPAGAAQGHAATADAAPAEAAPADATPADVAPADATPADVASAGATHGDAVHADDDAAPAADSTRSNRPGRTAP